MIRDARTPPNLVFFTQNIGVDMEEFRKVSSWVTAQVRKKEKNSVTQPSCLVQHPNTRIPNSSSSPWQKIRMVISRKRKWLSEVRRWQNDCLIKSFWIFKIFFLKIVCNIFRFLPCSQGLEGPETSVYKYSLEVFFSPLFISLSRNWVTMWQKCSLCSLAATRREGENHSYL